MRQNDKTNSACLIDEEYLLVDVLLLVVGTVVVLTNVLLVILVASTLRIYISKHRKINIYIHQLTSGSGCANRKLSCCYTG